MGEGLARTAKVNSAGRRRRCARRKEKGEPRGSPSHVRCTFPRSAIAALIGVRVVRVVNMGVELEHVLIPDTVVHQEV